MDIIGKLNIALKRRLHYTLIGIVSVLFVGLLTGLLSARAPLSSVLIFFIINGIFLYAYILFKEGIFSIQCVVVPLLVGAILSPTIRIFDGIPGIRLEFIIVLIAWGIFLGSSFVTGRAIRFYKNPMYKWFILFALTILTSIVYSALVKGYYPIMRDFFELIKLFLYFLIFALIANLKLTSANLRRYYKIALIFFLCSAFWGFFQLLNIGNIPLKIVSYYAPTQIDGLLIANRIVGTSANPNEFGAIMILASMMALSGMLFFKQKKARLFLLFCLAVFLLAIVFSQSRSCAIASTIAMCFMIFVQYPLTIRNIRFIDCRRLKKRRKRLVPLLAILLVIVISIIIVKLTPAKYFYRITKLKDISTDTSWQGRVTNWYDDYQAWHDSPFFGWGPGKMTMGTIVDNEWLLLLRRYGVVGVIIFVGFFLSFYFGLSKIYKCSPTEETLSLTMALKATLVAYGLYMFPAAVYHCPQLFITLILFLGLAFSQYKNKKDVCP